MNISCSAEPCPVILNSTCVFYEGANLIYTGILTNDNLQTALEKIDQKFQDAGLGYIFQNGIIQTTPGAPVTLGGSLTQNTTITSAGFNLTLTGDIYAAKFITTGGTSSQFVKGDGTLDGTSYQPAGNYITSLTGDGTASGPGSAVFTLANTAVVPNVYGSSTQVPIITVNSKGLITNLTTTLIYIPSDALFFSGDVAGSGVTGANVTLTLNNVNPNPFGSITPLKFKVNAKGLVTDAAALTNLDLDAIYGYTPVPTTRTLTINGVTQNLAANRSWTIPVGTGTVTSVGVSPGTGISASVANPTTTPVITITNTLPDQTVVLNNGTGISVTGTYPNFTITNTGVAPSGSALTKTDDTNVTLTLGGSPSTALLAATSLTLGWTGTLADSRIASASTWNGKQDALSGTGVVKSTAGLISYISGTSAQFIKGDGSLDSSTYLTSAVTSVATAGLISGGTITGTGTITTSMATNKLVGRSSAGIGIMEEITVGSGLSLSGGTLNASGAASPLTTKGDIYTYSTVDARLPVGLDTQVLLADSSTTTGLKWGSNTAATPTGYYAMYQDVLTQTIAVINTGYPINFRTLDLSNGVTVVSNSRITFANTGIYNLQFSVQLENSDSQEHDVTIWLRKNGVDVVGSSGFVAVVAKHGGINGHVLPSWNYLLNVVGGEYYELVWSATSTQVTMPFIAAGSPPPSTASAIFTVTQQSGIMAGTGISRGVYSVSSNTAAGSAANVDYVYLVSGTTTITLPTAVGNTNRYTIKNTGTNVVSIATTSSQTIDGSASPITINVQNVSLDIISDGANWNII